MKNKQQKVSLEDAKKAKAETPSPKSIEIEKKYAQKTLETEQGTLGKLIGSRNEKAGNVAFIVLLFCFIVIVVLFVRLDIKEHFDKLLELLTVFLGIITLILGYLFGSAGKD